jgi:multisubunit Na+/H+ antiporter MnhG subunit
MSALTDALLGLAVFSAWVGAFTFLRFDTPLERIHPVTFFNVVTLGLLTLAGFTSRGVTPQTLKCVLLWLTNITVGALLSHAVARAIHLRGGMSR